jgi:hypothetical protein
MKMHKEEIERKTCNKFLISLSLQKKKKKKKKEETIQIKSMKSKF